MICFPDREAAGRQLAAVLQPRINKPDALVLALPRGGVPVAFDSAFAMMGRPADEAVCVAVPEPFYGVGRFYTDFRQTQDSEVMDLLAQAAEIKGQSHVS